MSERSHGSPSGSSIADIETRLNQVEETLGHITDRTLNSADFDLAREIFRDHREVLIFRKRFANMAKNFKIGATYALFIAAFYIAFGDALKAFFKAFKL